MKSEVHQLIMFTKFVCKCTILDKVKAEVLVTVSVSSSFFKVSRRVVHHKHLVRLDFAITKSFVTVMMTLNLKNLYDKVQGISLIW